MPTCGQHPLCSVVFALVMHFSNGKTSQKADQHVIKPEQSIVEVVEPKRLS